MEIGVRIKALRSLQNITLEELSNKTGLSVSFHSQLERDKVSPSINSLQKIAEALNTTIGHFFETEENQGMVVVKKSTFKKICIKENEIFCEPLASGILITNMISHLLYLEIGAKLTEDLFFIKNRGEAFGFLIRGTLELICEKEKFIFEEGDSIYCNRSHCPQEITNIGNIKAKLFWIIFL